MKQRKNILIYLGIVMVIVTGLWVIQLMRGEMPFVDQWTRPFVDILDQTILFEAFQYVTHLGSSFFLYPFVTVVAILFMIWFRSFLPGLFFGLGTYLTHKVNEWIKVLVTRERPSLSVDLNAEGYSFPSGHAMISIVCYGLLAYFITRKLKSKRAILFVQIGCSLVIFLVGISRYVINVHYLTDVLAGFFFGFLLLFGFIYLYEYIRNLRPKAE